MLMLLDRAHTLLSPASLMNTSHFEGLLHWWNSGAKKGGWRDRISVLHVTRQMRR